MINFTASPEIQAALEKRELRYAEIQGGAIGKLNTIDTFVNRAGELFCLRREKTNNRGWIKEYLQELYDAMGGKQHGLEISYRNVVEQVAHMKRLRTLGINVPEIMASGSDWMLMSFLTGDPLSEVLPSATPQITYQAITTVMNAWMEAHLKGECLWDRCGKNELYSAPKTASFIDFDIDIRFSTSIPLGIQASYDMAMGIRAYLLQAKHRDIAASAIIESLSGNNARLIYQPRHLSEVLGLQIEYYRSLASTSDQADFYAPQKCVEPYIGRILDWLRNDQSTNYQLRKHDPHKNSC